MILDRNFGTFNTTTGVTISRSTGVFGTGTIVAVLLFGNTTFPSLAAGGWTVRHSSVVNLGLYACDRTAAGETNFALTAGATGTGEWYMWEMTAGSTYVTGALGQIGSSISYPTTAITPTAGDRHLLAVTGGTHASLALSVTGYSNSFTLGAGGQVLAQDQPFSARAERDMTNDGIASVSTTGTFSNTSSGAAGGGMLAYVNVGGAADTTPPSVPAGLATTAVGSTTVDLSWSASTDDTAVTGYEIQVVGP